MSIELALPLDLTGENPVNRRTAEEHEVNGVEEAIFALDFGPFYSKGLTVRSTTHNHILVPGEDFVALHFYEEASRRSGLEVLCVIYILKPELYGRFVVDYQAVGGEFVNMISVIEELIENLNFDNRPVNWGDIIGLPDTFPPANHFHDLGDLYGFEYLTEALENLRQAILMGDQASHEEIMAYIDQVVGAVIDSNDAVFAALNAHESSLDNPHLVTKAQVGLGNVQNLPLANRTIAETGASNAYYMTPLMTSYLVAVQALQPLNTHIDDDQNPHGVTKAQVGLGNVENYSPATLAEARAGETGRYLLANIGLQVMQESIATALEAYSNLGTNPTGVTKAQVGLGNVQNYGISTTSQAIAGLVNDSYMTPARTADAIEALSPVQSVQGRTGDVVLTPADRVQLQLGIEHNVKFRTVEVGNELTGSSAQRLRLIAAGTLSRLLHIDGNIQRNYYMPHGQSESPNGTMNMRLLSTEYMKRPYAFALRSLISGSTTTVPFNIYDSSYHIIAMSGGTAPVNINFVAAGGEPNTGRDKANTDMNDGKNNWGYVCTIKINPGNRTVTWTGVNWGDAGAPQLKPNSWNFINIIEDLSHHAEDNIHWYGGRKGVFIGGGF